MKQGKVYLIGAGPGDPELLTLKGKRCLEEADVVVGDYLADKRILRFMRPDAEYVYVGKKAGCHTMRQQEISRLLAEKGKQGHIVARLKGGDPFVFGRGGEEIEVLKEAGVPFEEVPGVTSAIAAPAYAGIPVTHRKVAASFAVITGHEDPTKNESSIHWDKLAGGVDTLIFLMGVGHTKMIADQLMKYGRSKDTPAAFIRWGTRPYQETFTTTLREAAADVERLGIRPPAVFIVGDVVNLRKDMRWFDNRPLFGKRVIVTRSRNQASRLVDVLNEKGAETIEIPTISIREPSDGYDPWTGRWNTFPLTTGFFLPARTGWTISSTGSMKREWTREPLAMRKSAPSGRLRLGSSRPTASMPMRCRKSIRLKTSWQSWNHPFRVMKQSSFPVQRLPEASFLKASGPGDAR